MNQYELAAVTAIAEAVEQLCGDNLPVTVTTKRVSTVTEPGRDRITHVRFNHGDSHVDVLIAVDHDSTIYRYPFRENDKASVRTDVDDLAMYIHDLI